MRHERTSRARRTPPPRSQRALAERDAPSRLRLRPPSARRPHLRASTKLRHRSVHPSPRSGAVRARVAWSQHPPRAADERKSRDARVRTRASRVTRTCYASAKLIRATNSAADASGADFRGGDFRGDFRENLPENLPVGNGLHRRM